MLKHATPMKTIASVLAASLLFFYTAAVGAAVRLPAMFSDHMVLQRDVEVPIWGWAEPGERVTVSVAAAADANSGSDSESSGRATGSSRRSTQSRAATADARGSWKVRLGKLQAGEPLVLTVQGKNLITINDVLVGEVWLGSGQSNMAMRVRQASNYEQERTAANLPQMRMFKEESGSAATAQTDAKGKWVVCAPDTAGEFSATLFFFGRELQKTLGVPVGLMDASVGGSPIESWIEPQTQRASVELRPFFSAIAARGADVSKEDAIDDEKEFAPRGEAAVQTGARGQRARRGSRDRDTTNVRKPEIGSLFNGKIAPLIPYAIRGAIWYQGEANTKLLKAPFYEQQLKLLVTDWRARWGYEFPFAWAQLAGFSGPGRDWPTVREGMLKALDLPRTGMGINIDIGEEMNIHPRNKQEVGRRLSLWALGTVYGENVPTTSGPLPAGYEIRGDKVILSFTHADGGLVANGSELRGFMIAGADRLWRPAAARIEGSKVIVSSLQVKRPVAARYAWENFPRSNLYNGAGLPATPFRTDDWK